MKTEWYPAVGDCVMISTPPEIAYYDGQCGTVSHIDKSKPYPICVQLEDDLELCYKIDEIIPIVPSINIDDNIHQQLDKLYNQ